MFGESLSNGRKSKRIKVSEKFRDLIDFEMPLWRDIFSIIFTFIHLGDLNRMLRSSKILYELVRERAVFPTIEHYSSFYKGEKSFLRALRTYLFKKIELGNDVDIEEYEEEREEEHPILRQRHLESMTICSHMIDLRIFLRRGPSGRYLFPKFNSLHCNHLESCRFWEFLKDFPRRLTLISTNDFSGETLEKLVKLGRFVHLDVDFFKYNSRVPDEAYSLLSPLDTISMRISKNETEFDFPKFLNAMKDNERLQRLEMIVISGRYASGSVLTELFDSIHPSTFFRDLRELEIEVYFNAEALRWADPLLRLLLAKESLRRFKLTYRSGGWNQQSGMLNYNSEIIEEYRKLCNEVGGGWKFELLCVTGFVTKLSLVNSIVFERK